jgi:nitric oxide reductase subunit B
MSVISNKNYWAFYFLVVVAICVGGIGYFAEVAHYEVPPLCNFVGVNASKVIISAKQINDGERIFHLRGMMSYGSFLGDGSERGVDFTADSLHQMADGMMKYYQDEFGASLTAHDELAIESRVRIELRDNKYDAANNQIVLTAGQVSAWDYLIAHYKKMNSRKIFGQVLAKEEDIINSVAFFYWGAWLSAAARPGEVYSYTHNWPHEPAAGNVPTPAVILWSAVSVFVLCVGMMITLYLWGQVKHEDEEFSHKGKPLTTQDLESGVVRPTQVICYKFFVLSIISFAIQVLAGVACAIDFVSLGAFGDSLKVTDYMPYSVLRSYHTTFQIFWFFTAWVGTTVWFLPRFAKVPYGQHFLINVLFIGCCIVAVGGVVGIPLGQSGFLEGSMAYYFGSQGWEFMELGRLFQDLLLTGFVLWIAIMYRAMRPFLNMRTIWSTPAWLFYGSLVMVWFLFFSLKVTPKANFIVADFWRWMVVHMWVEVTFEVFTTVIIAFLYREMGLISKTAAERATYIAVMLFFLTATIGVGHNFYWIAKPTGVIALGSAFSTTQVIPLMLLTLDAWKFIQMHEKAQLEKSKGNQKHVMSGVWLFMLGVNFWNIFGAGILGSFINLPVVNYYMHATYLTANHAHAAMWGVKGNMAIAGMMFCVQHTIKPEQWNDKLVSIAFWSLNGGIVLMMFLSLFPIGMIHMYICVGTGLYAARTQEFQASQIYQTLSKGRAIGGHAFLWGGLFPLVYFVCSRYFHLKSTTKDHDAKKYKSFWIEEDAEIKKKV